MAALFGNGSSAFNRSSYNATTKQTGGKLFVSTGISYAVLKKFK